MKIVLAIVVLFIAASFFIVKDYGINFDERENFGIGHKYLHFYRTGHLDFNDNLPEKAKDLFTPLLTNVPHVFFPLPNILAAIASNIFNIGFVPSHHIAIPFMLAGFLPVMYLFVRKHWGNFCGIASVLILLTYPRFFGHSFSNIKDVPNAIFMAITVMLLADWFMSGKLKFLYFGAIALGCAMATKMNAVFILPIILLWQMPNIFIHLKDNLPINSRTLGHILLGLVLSMAVLILFYPPLFYFRDMNFLKGIITYTYTVGRTSQATWNLYAPMYLLYVTPPLMIISLIAGFICLLRKKTQFNWLLIAWVLFLILRHALPGMRHYDGIRHFLWALIPLSIIAAVGIKSLYKPLLGVLVALNLLTIISLHPYQTTYFNFLIGGLKGAQEKEYPYACDYYLNSYRQAGKWLDQNAKPNANYYAFPYDDLFSFSVSRKDLMPLPHESMVAKSINHLEMITNAPLNTYIVVIPRKWWLPLYTSIDDILAVTSQLEKVYEIKRKGGEILTIYYK